MSSVERTVSVVEPATSSSEHSPVSLSLPVYLTRFVGREQERATLPALLLSKRLLTLIGAGGVGKTRLALEVATELSASFPESVYMVELASLSDPALVPQAITPALGVQTDRDSSATSILKAALRERRVLLFLDNCEHVRIGCAPLVEALLQACPHLHILATSREPFEMAGETVWRVAALSSPDPSQLPPVELLARYEAVQLFCERAVENNPRFRLTQQNTSAVARICHQLDGLPLALELAAALLHMLSVDQLAARLNERFTLLRHSKRTGAARHLSLQATLDWSYALLTPAEQALFGRLAVFSGSWDLDAVEQICAPATPDSPVIFEMLARLVNTSLVIAEEQEGPEKDKYDDPAWPANHSAEVRYRLLDTMHQYALEKLQQAGDWQQLCERHYTWYLHLAERANKHLYGAKQLVWLHRLEVETANMRVALTRALAAGNLDAAAQLADMLSRFWITHNYFSEGRYWFETLLSAESDDHQLSPPLRARVLFGAAEFARYQGALDRACSLLEEQMALVETLDDAFGLAESQTYLGVALGLRGDYERATELCQTALAFYREKGYHRGITTVLTTLALVTLAQGHYQRTIVLSEEVSQLLREAGNQAYLLYALFTLAQAALFQGALEQARAACREALQLAQVLRQMYGLAASLGLIGGLAGLGGHHAQAARLFGGAQALQEHVRAPHPPAGRALLERMVLSTRAALGKEQFISHYSAGQACPLEQLLLEAETVLQTIPSSLASTSSASFPSPSVSSALSVLSQREREILALVATGLTDAQVAQHLFLSPRTVSKHLQSIYTKLNVNTRSAATHFALEHGLV
jgi:predicted ATPase/DNA-binding CsgD family transcriptional regulator